MKPLVSIMIPNYNYSYFLDQCILSARRQTYENLEIIVLDNTSSDDSLQIACKHRSDRRVLICRNQFNIHNRSYTVLADELAHGKYMMLLCADDYIEPTFIEEAVDIMEAYPNVGYVHGEKEFVHNNGTIEHYDSFFNCSFIAPGINMMPIYMVTPIAHPSQGVFRRSTFLEMGGYEMEIDHMNADRSLWFYMSDKCDAAYFREKRSGIRIGDFSVTSQCVRDYRQAVMSHLIIKDFVRYAREKGYKNVLEREKEAWQRFAAELVQYGAKCLLADDYPESEKYLTHAVVVDRDIVQNDLYIAARAMLDDKTTDVQVINRLLPSSDDKKRGYNPPKGFKEIRIGKEYGKQTNSSIDPNL